MNDPTYEEMMAYLKASSPPLGVTADIAEGIYWFASERANTNHPNLYNAASKCGFRPGPIPVMSSESIAFLVYEMLCEEYDVLPDEVIDKILTSVPGDAPEDKDLYDPPPP
jgi:hypothetical protein